MEALEERARELLQAAADTIEVRPEVITPTRRGRAWPLVAAAVVIALVGGVVLVLAVGEDESPDPSPRPTEVVVPQLFLMTTDQATSTLEDRGLRARFTPAGRFDKCGLPEGRAIGSEPGATSVVASGSTVVVQVLEAGGGVCGRPRRFEDAVALLDLARFGEEGLRFAPDVQIWVDGEQTATLTSAQAADPEAWGDPSPLTRMVEALGDVWTVNGRSVSPTVWQLVDKGSQFACGPHDPPAPLTERESTVVTVDHNVDGRFQGCHWVRVFRDSQGRVDAVSAADLPRGIEPPPSDAPAEPTVEQRAVAEAFVAFAREGEAPDFAPEVRLLLGSTPVATVSAAQAADPSTWLLGCEFYAERSCPIHSLTPLRRTARPAVTGTVVRERSACHDLRGDLPADLAQSDALARSVSISAPEPPMCMDAWELQLWFDDNGAIWAANLILGSP